MWLDCPRSSDAYTKIFRVANRGITHLSTLHGTKVKNDPWLRDVVQRACKLTYNCRHTTQCLTGALEATGSSYSLFPPRSAEVARAADHQGKYTLGG